MNFKEAIQSGFSNYVNFRSRACRSEFWYWQLFLLIGGVIAEIFDYGIGSSVSALTSIFWLATIIPDLAVYVRRLHDTDRNGWWLLLFFVPLLGAIVLLVWLCTRGSDGYNRFGADPLPPEAGPQHRIKAPE
jgi:uncharacterized membrane protein YhaH (DUF805 family)